MERPTAQQFSDDGFVVLRGLLQAPEIALYVARLKECATATRWTLPDGVNRHPEFWPLLFNDRLLQSLKAMLGPDIRYLPHNDLHVGFSSFSWHRDSVSRYEGSGPDWDETREPYRLARVGFYLQSFAESHFRFGVVRGSHRPDRLDLADHRRVNYRTSAVANVIGGLSGFDMVGPDAEWIEPEAGDCIVFDPRLLHTGSRFHGDKYSIFVAYGLESRHFHNHWHYYRHMRRDLNYGAIPAALAAQLRDAHLLAAEPPASLVVEGAWLPSPAYTYVAKRFK